MGSLKVFHLGADVTGRMFEKGALRILKDDHKAFQDLLKTLDKSEDANEQRQVREELARELLLHAKVEEELFYPRLKAQRRAEDEKPVDRAFEEHALAEKALYDLLAATPGTSQFGAKVDVLRGLVVAHAKEEEAMLFRMAKRNLGNDEIEALGKRMEARKRALRDDILKQVEQRTV